MPDLNNYFFDSHIHLYNLSHMGFLAFVNRLLLNKSISLRDIGENRYFTILWRIFSSENWFYSLLKKFFLFIILIIPYIIGFISPTIIFKSNTIPREILFFLSLISSILSGIVFTIIIFLVIKVLLIFKTKKIINILSLTENDLGSILLYLELDYIYLFLKNAFKADEKKFKDFIKEIKKKIRIKKIKNMKEVEILLLEFIPVSWKADKGYIFKYDDMTIRKVILTPLMMDFDGKGFKGDEQVHYNLPPYKPIVEQVVDIFNGIKRYNKKTPYHLFEVYPFMGINPQNYDCTDDDTIPIPQKFQSLKKNEIIDEIKKCFKPDEQESCIALLMKKTGIYMKADYSIENMNKENKFIIIAVEEISQTGKNKLLEAIDPDYKENTGIKQIIERLCTETYNNSLQKLLYKYFGDYDARKDLHREFLKQYNHNFIKGNYNGDIDGIRSYFFAGIKLYPALGFDPWPDGRDKTREKVEFLYGFCAAKKIPLTVHCQDTGFGTINKKMENKFTDPGRWKEVLEHYPDLKINFAHLGLLEKEKKYPPNKWVRKIIEYMNMKKEDNPKLFRYPNIYADFACKGRKEGNYDFYRYFALMLKNYRTKQNIDIINRILFGSDFPLLLFFHKSYEHYLSLFMGSGYFTQREKTLFFNHNPAQFLFNTIINDEES